MSALSGFADLSKSVEQEVGRLTGRSARRLDSYAAIVTGAGMSSEAPIGTGAAIAHLFAAHGARVLVMDVDRGRGERTCESMGALGGEALLFLGDVTDEAVCSRASEVAASTWGRLDVLVNNVGISPQADVTQVSVSDWDDAHRTNVTSAMLMSKHAGDLLARTRGSIINISSIAAVRSFGAVCYAASKSALIALTRESAYTLGPRGVRANCILPGHIYAAMSAALTDQARESRKLANLLGVEGTAWDVAAAALFLASDDARWITGATIPVDAGTINVTSLGMVGMHDGGMHDDAASERSE